MGKKEIRVGLDLDGVIAGHSLGGFWVRVRKFKERFLKKLHNRSYFYPKTFLEMTAWKVINWLRIPDREGVRQIATMEKEGYKFYLITGRFKFNYPSTIRWLKKYKIYDLFEKTLVNIEDQDPIKFKQTAIKREKISCFVDDDLEVLSSFTDEKLKLFWVVPGHRNGNENGHKHIVSCQNFYSALRTLQENT